jgi:hypothetical protein
MSNDTKSGVNKIISLEEFLTLPASDIALTVRSYKSKSIIASTYYPIELFINHFDFKKTFSYEITAQKTSDEYESLYKSLQNMNKNLKLPEFPSKFKIRNREESRMNFFDYLVNTIIQCVKKEDEVASKHYLSMIYKFVIESTLKDMPKKIKIKSPISSDNLNKYFSGLSNNSEISKEYANLDFLNSSFISEGAINNEGGNISRDMKDIMNTSFTSVSSLKKEKGLLTWDLDTIDTEFENTLSITALKDQKYYDWNNISIKMGKHKEFKGYIKITEQCLFISVIS